MNIAIIGAGYTALTAAYHLGAAGHDVTLFEVLPHPGGLAAGFKADHWEWPLEKFYHHLFTNDDAIIGFAERLGVGDKLTRYSPSTDLIHEDEPHPFDGPLAVLRYPGFNVLEKARVGLSVAYLKARRDWAPFERVTAHEWMQRWMGSAYDKQFGPLLRGKFGESNYRHVPMTWMWARFFKRTPKLIYPDGGFQTLTDAMVTGARAYGATLRLSTPVRALRPEGAHWWVESKDGAERFDHVVVTTSPALLSRLVPSLPASYLSALRELSHMGAVVLTVALKHQLLERSYWLNLDKRETPMLSLVEHTNMVNPAHYGGDRLVYLGDYLPPDHPYLGYDVETLFEVYEPVLRRFNPSYERAWVRDMWLFSTSYAQPVPTLRHARRIPALKTPLDGLYFASMSQVYPWDRGTNYAVELGERVANALLADVAPSARLEQPGEPTVNAV